MQLLTNIYFLDGKVNTNLKRENSNGSNEALKEKARAAIRRWLSQEFEPPVKQEMKKEKKKKAKQTKQGIVTVYIIQVFAVIFLIQLINYLKFQQSFYFHEVQFFLLY